LYILAEEKISPLYTRPALKIKMYRREKDRKVWQAIYYCVLVVNQLDNHFSTFPLANYTANDTFGASVLAPENFAIVMDTDRFGHKLVISMYYENCTFSRKNMFLILK